MHNGAAMDTEYTCSICWNILLYPVRLPCNHIFCKSCLDKHIENNKMLCPNCRSRLYIWLRKLRRSGGDIVDKPFWDNVQKFYPKEVEKRINGHVDYQTPSTLNDPIKRRLAKPGEIHQEYEQFLKKELEEKRQMDEKNYRLSEAVIRKIEEEERRQEEERLQQLQKDEELARRLEVEASTDGSDTTSDGDRSRVPRTPGRRKHGSQKLLQENMDTPSLPSGDSTFSLPKSRMSFGNLSTSTEPNQHAQSPTCSNASTPSTSKGTPIRCSQSPIQLGIPSTSKKNIFTKFWSSSPTSSCIGDKNSLDQDNPLTDSKTSAISNKELSHFVTVCPGPSYVTKEPKSKKKKEMVPSSSRCSSGCDSIGQELNHFKPIRTSPTTPPKEGSRGLVPKMVVAQRGVGVCDLSILSPDLLSANISVEDLETSINLEKQLEEDRRLAMEIQNQMNKEMKKPVKTDYNLRKRKRPSGSLNKKVSLDRTQTTLDKLLIK